LNVFTLSKFRFKFTYKVLLEINPINKYNDILFVYIKYLGQILSLA